MATIIPESPAMPPTDRSKAPVSRIIDWPMQTIPITEIVRPMAKTFFMLRK